MKSNKNSKTTNLKLFLLSKRKAKYKAKLEKAFFKVRAEIIEFIKSVEQPSTFVKYLSTCIGTTDLITFINIMEGIIEDAKKAPEDPEAVFAVRFCKYALIRLHWLSGFTFQWTNVKVECNHCHNIIPVNFCYTDKICPICGHILIKE